MFVSLARKLSRVIPPLPSACGTHRSSSSISNSQNSRSCREDAMEEAPVLSPEPPCDSCEKPKLCSRVMPDCRSKGVMTPSRSLSRYSKSATSFLRVHA